jgi:hypothetical protein
MKYLLPCFLQLQPVLRLRAIPGDFKQPYHLRINLSYREGECTVAVVSLQYHTAIDRDYISVPQAVIGRYSVYNSFIHRGTECGREPIVILEARRSAIVANIGLCKRVKFRVLIPGLM